MAENKIEVLITAKDQASATINKSTKAITDGIKDAEKQTKASTSAMLAHWKSMAAGIALTYGVYKTAALVKDTALLAARFETLGIVMNQVGKIGGYSAKQMDEYDLALRKTGISMIESRQSLTKMVQAHLDLNKATELGRVAQNAAVIANINSSDAFGRMIYGIQSGQTEILRNMGIMVSFDQAYQKAADTLGKTKAELTEAEKSTARMNAVLEKGKDIAGVYEAAMMTAGKKLSSFTRYIDDFKVQMGTAFGPATVILVDAATEAMKQMQVEISRPEAQEALKELSTQLAITITQLGKDLPKAIEALTGTISTLHEIYNSLPTGIVGAAGSGLIGTMLLGPKAGAIIALLVLTSAKIDEFKKQHPEIFDPQPLVQRFKIVMPTKLAPALSPPEIPVISDADLKKQQQSMAMIDGYMQTIQNYKAGVQAITAAQWDEIYAGGTQAQIDFNEQYAAIGKSRFDIEREQLAQQMELWRQAGVNQVQLAELTASKLKAIDKAEMQERINNIHGVVSSMTDGFKMISEMGGKHSKSAFAMYKAFKITETLISTYSGAMKAYEAMAAIPYVGPALGAAAAAMVVAFGMAQVSMIKNAQPPGYERGGIVYPSGDRRGIGIRVAERQAEAIVPLPDGRSIPVEMRGGGQGTANYFYIQAIDPKSFAEVVKRNPRAITQVISDDLNSYGPLSAEMRGALL